MHLQLQQFVFHITQPEGLFLSDHLIFLDTMAHFLQILRKCGGSLELVDVSGELPQLVRRPGIKKWKVSSWVLVLHFFYLTTGVPLSHTSDIIPMAACNHLQTMCIVSAHAS